MDYISKDEIDFIKNDIDMRKILEFFMLGNREDEWFLCPNKKEHKDTHPSCKYYESTNTLTCFVCTDKNGKRMSWDVISLWATLRDLDTKKNFVKICKEILNNSLSFDIKKDNSKKTLIKEIHTKTDEEYKKDIDYRISISKSIHDLHQEHKYFLDTYLSKRAINYQNIKEFLEDYNIDIRHNYYNNINSCYININNNLILCRQMEDYLKDNKKAQHNKCNFGKANFTYFNKYNNKTLIIFEGIYDMLSYISHNKILHKKYDYICLNSVNNLQSLINFDLKEDLFLKYDKIIIGTDNDKKGIECRTRIIDIIDELSIEYKIIKLENCKDVNDFYIKKGKEFIKK